MSTTLTVDLIESPIRPLSKRLVILPDEAPKTTKSGLHLPDASKETPSRGVVLAVSDDWDSDTDTYIGDSDPTVERGDRVVYYPHVAHKFEIQNGYHLLILDKQSVLAVIVDNEEKA